MIFVKRQQNIENSDQQKTELLKYKYNVSVTGWDILVSDKVPVGDLFWFEMFYVNASFIT